MRVKVHTQGTNQYKAMRVKVHTQGTNQYKAMRVKDVSQGTNMCLRWGSMFTRELCLII